MQTATIIIRLDIENKLETINLQLEVYNADSIKNMANLLYYHTKNVLDVTAILNEKIIFYSYPQ